MPTLDLETIDCGKDITRVVDMRRLGLGVELSDVAAYVAVYGVKVILARVHAEFTEKDYPASWKIDSAKAVDDKLAALYSGDVRRIATPRPQKVVGGLTGEQLFAMMTDEQKAVVMGLGKKKVA